MLREPAAFIGEAERQRQMEALRQYAAEQRSEPVTLAGVPRTKAQKRRDERRRQKARQGGPQ